MSFNNGLYHMDVEIIADIADKMKIIKEREDLCIGFVTWSKYENLMISWVQHPPDRYLLPGYSESDAKIPWLNVKAGNIISFIFYNKLSSHFTTTTLLFHQVYVQRMYWKNLNLAGSDGWKPRYGGRKSSIFLVSVSSSVDIAFFISSM